MFIPLTMDSEDEYWSEKEQATNDFQEHAILQSISDYTSKQFNKTPCQTLPLSREGYIQKLVQCARNIGELLFAYKLIFVF